MKMPGWIQAVIVAVVLPTLGWFAITVHRIDTQVAVISGRMAMMDRTLQSHGTFITDWRDVRKVPERDQHQDDSIDSNSRVLAELKTAVGHLMEQVTQLEKLYAQLGGPNDPLFAVVRDLRDQTRLQMGRLEAEIIKLRNGRC